MRIGPSRGEVKAQKLWWDWALLVAVTAALLAGAALWFADRRGPADLLWADATAVALLPAITWVVRSLLHRQVGVDVIAVLALAGALVVREYLAGAVIALMLATGRTVEAYAERRASRDLGGLLERAPRSARRRTPRGAIETVPLDAVQPDGRLLVGLGEVVPAGPVDVRRAADPRRRRRLLLRLRARSA
ncbi:hypothetical protein [Micromonospora sp. CPCC 205547]|uniref:hypothetical protein n=1 Tax=Micromonospora sp. CPCC 205547 TaxID=3122400 RepID=UPI003B969480